MWFFNDYQIINLDTNPQQSNDEGLAGGDYDNQGQQQGDDENNVGGGNGNVEDDGSRGGIERGVEEYSTTTTGDDGTGGGNTQRLSPSNICEEDVSSNQMMEQCSQQATIQSATRSKIDAPDSEGSNQETAQIEKGVVFF